MEMIACEDCGTVGHTNVKCQRCVDKLNQGFDDIQFLGPAESKRIHDEVLGAISRDRSANNGASRPGWRRDK